MDDKNEHAVHRRLHGKPIPIKPHKIKRPELREPMLVDLSKLKPKRPELIVAVEKVPPRVYVADARTPNQFMHWTLVDGKPKPLIEANPDRYYALRGGQKWHEYMVPKARNEGLPRISPMVYTPRTKLGAAVRADAAHRRPRPD